MLWTPVSLGGSLGEVGPTLFGSQLVDLEHLVFSDGIVDGPSSGTPN